MPDHLLRPALSLDLSCGAPLAEVTSAGSELEAAAAGAGDEDFFGDAVPINEPIRFKTGRDDGPAPEAASGFGNSYFLTTSPSSSSTMIYG